MVTRFYGRRDWANLMKWSKNVWKNESVYMEKDDETNESTTPGGAVVAAAHDIARGVNSWDECERALENLRYAVRALGQEWDGEEM